MQAGSKRVLKTSMAELLLLGGSKSSAFLKDALSGISRVLPGAKRVELPGLNHSSSWNKEVRGNPGKIAEELRKFFSMTGTR